MMLSVNQPSALSFKAKLPIKPLESAIDLSLKRASLEIGELTPDSVVNHIFDGVTKNSEKRMLGLPENSSDELMTTFRTTISKIWNKVSMGFQVDAPDAEFNQFMKNMGNAADQATTKVMGKWRKEVLGLSPDTPESEVYKTVKNIAAKQLNIKV